MRVDQYSKRRIAHEFSACWWTHWLAERCSHGIADDISLFTMNEVLQVSTVYIKCRKNANASEIYHKMRHLYTCKSSNNVTEVLERYISFAIYQDLSSFYDISNL